MYCIHKYARDMTGRNSKCSKILHVNHETYKVKSILQSRFASKFWKVRRATLLKVTKGTKGSREDETK